MTESLRIKDLVNNARWAAFDLDGVLSNVVDLLGESVTRLTGKPCGLWDRYDHHIHAGVSNEQLYRAMVEGRVLERARCFAGAARTVARFRAAGYLVAIVTARGFYPNAEAVTRDWLAGHGIEVDRLILVGSQESKVHALRSLGNVACYIDDHLQHLQDIEREGCAERLFLMHGAWNAQDSHFERLRRISDYADRILGAQQANA